MKWTDPINFRAQNINIIDYINIESGFNFLTQWNYAGATTVGEIYIDGIRFTKESANLGIFKAGSLLNIQSPFNITIINSQFSLINYISENFDVIVIQDSGDWTPDDNVIQNILFSNNTLTLDNSTQDTFINFIISISNANKRFKNVVISNNTFFDIIGAEKSILEVDFYSKGTMILSNNTFKNWSTINDILVANANDSIVMNNIYFDTWVAILDGFVSAGIAENITINGLSLIRSSRNTDLKPTSLIKLSTAINGNLKLNNLNFSQNKIKISIIQIDKAVGTLALQNSLFYNEIIAASTPYIYVQNIFKLTLANTTFMNMKADSSVTEIRAVMYFDNINIKAEDDILFSSLIVKNISISFINIFSASGSDNSIKSFKFENISVTDSVFNARNDLINLGPILTGAQLGISMKNIMFNNLKFVNLANMIHIHAQSGIPFTITNWSFTNTYGGSIFLEPVSTLSSTNKVSLIINNITVTDNDFSTKTFFILQKYWTLQVSDWSMKRNSGYFYGTIASILGKDSSATFTNCNFNNNNGINGGLFYITTRSTIYLSNCLLFSNFAVNAAVAYVENLGTLSIDNWTISYNMAILTGVVQVVDTADPLVISNTQIYKNTIVTYNTTATEVDNPNIWINLCFASDGYIAYLKNNKKVMNGEVVHFYKIFR